MLLVLVQGTIICFLTWHGNYIAGLHQWYFSPPTPLYGRGKDPPSWETPPPVRHSDFFLCFCVFNVNLCFVCVYTPSNNPGLHAEQRAQNRKMSTQNAWIRCISFYFNLYAIALVRDNWTKGDSRVQCLHCSTVDIILKYFIRAMFNRPFGKETHLFLFHFRVGYSDIFIWLLFGFG